MTKPTGVRVVETMDEGDSGSIVRTVAYREPKSYPTGTIDLHGTFETGKQYAALVTLGDEKPARRSRRAERGFRRGR